MIQAPVQTALRQGPFSLVKRRDSQRMVQPQTLRRPNYQDQHTQGWGSKRLHPRRFRAQGGGSKCSQHRHTSLGASQGSNSKGLEGVSFTTSTQMYPQSSCSTIL